VLGELPPIIYQDLHLELNPQQQQAYDDIWEQRYSLSKDQDCLSPANMLAVITRLKQICNYDMISGEACKLDAVDCLIESLASPSDKILIFSQYVTTLHWLSQKLRIRNAVFHGGLDAYERDQIVHDFEKGPGPRALLLSYQAGGVGLNLQAASTVIIYDRWWNPAVEDQAIQRAHRFGRDQPLTVVRLMVEGTVEERILEILAEKRDIFRLYVESAQTDVPRQLHPDALLRILRLHD
jgi:SNF2 family DNA or RNA helicase